MAHEQIVPCRLRAPLLAARDRMSGDKRDMFRQEPFHGPDDLAFDAAHIGDDHARIQLGQERFGQRGNRLHRRTHYQ